VVVSRDPPSAVLADQVKSLDWRARRAERKGRAPAAALGEAQAKLRALLGL
jgi:mRNA interferase MazF